MPTVFAEKTTPSTYKRYTIGLKNNQQCRMKQLVRYVAIYVHLLLLYHSNLFTFSPNFLARAHGWRAKLSFLFSIFYSSTVNYGNFCTPLIYFLIRKREKVFYRIINGRNECESVSFVELSDLR